MARYIRQEMNDLDGKGEGKVYYRMAIDRCIDFKELAKRIAYPGSGVTEGEVIRVAYMLASEMALAMADGCSVTIDNIGTFSATLGLEEDKVPDVFGYDNPERNAQSIMVDGVKFRASKELIHKVAKHCKLKRGGTSRVKHSPYSQEERIAKALEYLSTHQWMRISDYAELTGLGRTSASKELITLSHDKNSGITPIGIGSHKVYVKAK